MKGYNGHKNYNHWNVSLWIANDESLYRMARHHIRATWRGKDQAARDMLESLYDLGITHTPDGVKYTFTTIRAAMRGM